MSRNIEQIVNQQVMRWNEEQRVVAERSRREDTAPAPVICISRQFGALGGEVGRRVAGLLGFSFYGQELVDEIAKQAHVRRKVVESLDERNQDAIRIWVDEFMDVRSFRPTDYLRNLSQVLLTLGRHGKSVIIGRGAHLVLNSANSLRVRCIAPLEWCVNQVGSARGLNSVDAYELVQRVDAERATFYEQHFNVDIDDPLQFDLLINVATISVTGAARVVADAFETRFVDYGRPASVPPTSQVRAVPVPTGSLSMEMASAARR